MWYIISKNKFFSVAGMCLVVALVIVPITSFQIKRWSQETHAMRVSKAHNEKLVQVFESQLNLYRDGWEEKMTKLYSTRPSEDNLIVFLKMMETAARQLDLRDFDLANLQSSPAGQKKEFRTLRYTAKFQTTPAKFREFLDEFDDMPHYMEIIDFSIQNTDDAALSDIANVSLTFDLFIR